MILYYHKWEVKKLNEMEKKIDWKIIATGLICLTAIAIAAQFNGIDGTLMTLIIGVIALAIGVALPNPIKK